MKYTREQRERAVDLYIKYECCAADVIRELGYPSRTALWMWHRDRLEEERAGVPSTRGERYKRYSEEQKRVAVDHYLEYGKRLSRTMRMLGYPKSRQLLMAWVDELAPGQRKLRHGPVPEELKREAVVAVASGRLKSHEAAARLGVQAAVVRNWKRQMLNHPKEEPVEKPAEKTMPADPVETSAVKTPTVPLPDSGSKPDALAVLEAKVAELQNRLDELAGLDEALASRQARLKELDIELAIRRGALVY